MMMRRILFAFGMLFVQAWAAHQMPLPQVSFRLGSAFSGDTESTTLLAEIRDRTARHLNQNFYTMFYDATEQHDYFSHVELDIQDSTSTIAMTKVTLKGTVNYRKMPLPDNDFLMAIFLDAFRGGASRIFVEELQESDQEFLQDLTYLEVSVNDRTVSVQEVTPLSKSASQQQQDQGMMDTPLLILIIVFVVLGFLGLSISICYFCRSGSSPKPVPIDNVTKSSSQDLEIASTRSPSPEKSLVSQASSKFTYNPKSKMSDTLSFSQIDVYGGGRSSKSIDVEAWTRGGLVSPITPAFGSDLSAIEQRDDTPENKRKIDLSLIDEETQEEISYLKEDTLSNIKLRSPTMSHRNRSGRSPNHSAPLSETGWSDNLGSSFASEGSDVIKDLKNLSVQINKYRSHRR